MLKEAKASGLLVDEAREALVLGRNGGGYVAPNSKDVMHQSLTWKWWAAEFIPKRHYDWKSHKDGKRPNLFCRRTIPDGSLIHTSAYERGDDYVRRYLQVPGAIRVE